MNRSSISWSLSILWITHFEEKTNFLKILDAYISWLDDDKELKFWTLAHLITISLPYKFQLANFKYSSTEAGRKMKFLSESRFLTSIFSQKKP